MLEERGRKAMIATERERLPDEATLRGLIERRHRERFWGQMYMVSPVFIREVFGDGKVLVWFESMDSRPNYYVLRGDSGWLNDVGEVILEPDTCADIIRTIEDQTIGDCRRYSCRHVGSCYDDCPHGWPRIWTGTGGFAWGLYELAAQKG